MVSTTMPYEIMTWYLLPAVRKELAQVMLKSGMNQREAARRLGVTDAAISQYISGKRAYDVKLNTSVRRMIGSSAKNIMGGADVMQEINSICSFCLNEFVLCRLHKAHGAPRKCDLCFRVVRK